MERVIHIVDYYQRKNNNHIFSNKNVTTNFRCRKPWNTLLINKFGISYACLSPAWSPKSIGSILDYDNFNDFYNSYEARSIRQEILNNSYYYCNSNICGSYFAMPGVEWSEDRNYNPSDTFDEKTIANSMPTEVILDFDYTCNFECPSCRTSMINENTGPASIENFKIVEKIKHLIIDNIADKPITIRWAGGEPFISRAYQDLWQYIADSGKLNIRNVIQTNASYIHKRIDLLKDFLPYIDSIRVSFDAGTPSTYFQVRKHGDWKTLISNSKLLKDLIVNSKSGTTLISDYVVQQCNYKEMFYYATLAANIGFDQVQFSKMWNWGTWDIDEFNRRNVSDRLHPEYNLFLQELKKVKNLRRSYTVNNTIFNTSYWDPDLQSNE